MDCPFKQEKKASYNCDKEECELWIVINYNTGECAFKFMAKEIQLLRHDIRATGYTSEYGGLK